MNSLKTQPGLPTWFAVKYRLKTEIHHGVNKNSQRFVRWLTSSSLLLLGFYYWFSNIVVMMSNGGDSSEIVRELEELKLKKAEIEHRISTLEAKLQDTVAVERYDDVYFDYDPCWSRHDDHFVEIAGKVYSSVLLPIQIFGYDPINKQSISFKVSSSINLHMQDLYLLAQIILLVSTSHNT